MIVQHNVPYTVNMNGVFFNMSPLPDELVRQIDEIIKRREERKQQQVAILCLTTLVLSCESQHVGYLLVWEPSQ
ncbi:MAG: hypothetical protein ACKPKO_30490, partial [Candidatus Fonsibacter sp.]